MRLLACHLWGGHRNSFPRVRHISPPNLIQATISLNNNLLSEWEAKSNPAPAAGTFVTCGTTACLIHEKAPMLASSTRSNEFTFPLWLKLWLTGAQMKQKQILLCGLAKNTDLKKKEMLFCRRNITSAGMKVRMLCVPEDKESGSYINCRHSKDE